MRRRTSQGLARTGWFALSWSSGALALACGGSDATFVQRPEPRLAETAPGTHVTLRSGHDVSGYCAASKGPLSAFAVIERSGVRLHTSLSPALEESSFRAGPPLAGFDTVARCQLAATAEGFVLAWVGTTPDGPGVLVQRLSDDGTPLSDPLPVALTSRDRFAFAARDQRLYLGRIADAGAGPEIWIDSVESDQVASELIAGCSSPSVPVLLPNADAIDVWYVCNSEETAELMLSRVVDGERRSITLESGAAGLAEPALGAVDLGQRWAVIWANSVLEEFPPLLEIDKDSLEITEHAVGEPRASVPWEVSLFERDGELLLRADVCQSASETGQIPCGVELCALELGDQSASTCSWLDADNSAELLPRETGAILAFLEFGQDGGGDLFSVPVDDDLVIATTPAPVLGPGRLDPLRVACQDAACTVFGHEGASRLQTPALSERSSAERYGFWTTANASDAGEVTAEAVVLDVSHAVLSTEIRDFDWSVAAVWWAEGTPQFGLLDAAGVRQRRSDFGYREPLALFHEDSGGLSRYRLFSFDTTLDADSGLYLTTFDDAAIEPAVRVAFQSIDPIGRCGTRYVGVDSDRRLHSFDPELDSEFVPGAALPGFAAADGELVRCLGERVAGVSYSATETRVYREEADGNFREWQFSDPGDSVPGSGGQFRATAGQLDDGRSAFILQPGGGFGVPLVALLLGEAGEPEAVELELPEGAALAAAATPERQPSQSIVLAWSQAATRETMLSTFELPD